MIKDNLSALIQSIPSTVTLVAVSKTKPVASLLEAHQAGQRDFGKQGTRIGK